MHRFFHIATRCAAAVSLMLTATACAWIHDDLPECPPTELRLRFEYDYNIMRADVFKDQVGGVCVLVFDDQNRFVMQKSESDPSLLGVYGYEMIFNDQELKLDRPYRFVTLAWQADEEELMKQEGAKFRRTTLQPGDDLTSLTLTLDRSATPTAEGVHAVENAGRGLDTLWMSRNECRASLHLYETSTATANLLRHTNNLTVTLRQIDRPTDIDIADFDISLTDRNGTVLSDNSLWADDDLLVYTPYATWNTDFKDEEGNVAQRAAHADLSFARLLYHDEWQQNARLQIRNRQTGVTVADINLPDYLAQGRNSQEQQYSPQEFLDREHTYHLDFFLKGDTWEYVELRISVLSWSVRIQNVEL